MYPTYSSDKSPTDYHSFAKSTEFLKERQFPGNDVPIFMELHISKSF